MRTITDRPEIVMVGTGDIRVLYGTAANIRAALAVGQETDAFHAITSPELAGDDTVRVGVHLLKPGPDAFVTTIHPTARPAGEPRWGFRRPTLVVLLAFVAYFAAFALATYGVAWAAQTAAWSFPYVLGGVVVLSGLGAVLLARRGRRCRCGRRLSAWRALFGHHCRGCENQIRMGGGPLEPLKGDQTCS